MSMTLDVIRNKNKREREARSRREQDIREMRVESAYRYALHNSMGLIDLLLDDEDVKSVEVVIPQQYLSQFLKVIYYDEMADYTVVQLDVDKFRIGRRLVNF